MSKIKIPLRTTLDETIFDEMEEKFPSVTDNGVQIKQTVEFFSMPSDFDFDRLLDFCEDSNFDFSKIWTTLTYFTSKMCVEHGFYFVLSRSFVRYFASIINVNYDDMCYIIEKLCEHEYLFNFDDRICNIYAVRTYECTMSARAARRKYKNKTDETEETSKSKKSKKTEEKETETKPKVEIVMEDFDINDYPEFYKNNNNNTETEEETELQEISEQEIEESQSVDDVFTFDYDNIGF